ncbi:beta-lactamase/transpeptidase-like protein [Aspergillus eucalypticola CBS 122712]|uniref:Beta-lactamase/transpeptidase-like protein n=1 Tax=Aspergillus eucalypticola (strain CBS 122712 / IBT 29274) TaxID=1448314 RepID=A0A317UWR7_ASPEC|nr:beta-lactamase/transpeptidase-like protein [Aspergillus eucalypticola CBS 122712]PWY64410.1 beta-lactamase/transpeptidase-like protein [Aspergillus eucalypticola CBS 122712]
MDEEGVLNLGCQVLPWISNQVILVGQQTRNTAYGMLGCELFVLSQLLKIFKIIDKACSMSRNEADRFQALGRIRSYKDSTSNIRQTVIREIQESLTHFTEPLYTEEYQDVNDIGYSGYLNQVLYTQLQTYAKCGCCTVHLESTQLPFLPTNFPSFVQWKASIVKVPRQTDFQKSKKKVGFASLYCDLLSLKRNSSLLSQRLRRLERGEFCKPVQFCIQLNMLQPFCAYTIAKSVWQYYNSPIQLLIEETANMARAPLTSEECPHSFSENVVNDYYTSNLRDMALFGGDSTQQYRDTQQIMARQNKLSEAYQDDWVAHHVISETFIASQFPHQADFTVDAVSAFLYRNSPGDSNTYTLGRIGCYKTALSVVSQASSLIWSTYPNIKLALVVGICGEILLGDIVHDFGRRIPGAFLPKALVADGLGRPNIQTFMVQELITQTLGNDNELYEPSYQHKHRGSTTCIRCADSSNTTVCGENFVKRKCLQAALREGHTPSPAIYLGLIASGDTVMKSGQDRDIIAMRDNAIVLPCLVVKGAATPGYPRTPVQLDSSFSVSSFISLPPTSHISLPSTQIQSDSSAMVLRQERNPLTPEFDALVDELLGEWHIPGLAVSIVHGSSTYAKAYGYASFPSTPMTTTSLFTTCSTTKAFTAAAMSLAIDDSQSTPHPISWSTPISSIIRDDFVLSTPSATTYTTIEDILSHRSGLPGHFFSINLAHPKETLRTEVRRLRWLPLAFPPRTKFNYNNHMFMAATYLLEHINGEGLGTTLKRRIWDPLDMNDTYFSTAEVQRHPNLSRRLVKGYTWNPETHAYYEEQYINYAPITGTGSMVSNVMDYAKWLRAMLYQAPPISKEGHTALRIPRTVIAESDWENMLAPPGAYHLYTMGWFIDYYHGEQLYWHPGSWAGFGIMVGFLPAKDFAFAMMGNTQNARIAELNLFLYLIDQLLGKSGADRETHVRKLGAKLKEMERMYNESVESVVARLYPNLKMRLPLSLSLGAYTGTYAHPGYGEFEVCEKSGKLVVDLRDRVGSCSMRFEHVSGEFFVVKYYNPEAEAVGPDYTKAEFYVDEQGVPKSLGLDLESVLGEKIWFRRME